MPHHLVMFIIVSPSCFVQSSAATCVPVIATPAHVSLVYADRLLHVTSMLVLTHLARMLLISASRSPHS